MIQVRVGQCLRSKFMQEKPNPESVDKKQEILRPKKITTAKGSVYTYLPDGRTQRYKKTTGEIMEPMDIMVFVPAWDVIKYKIPKVYERFFKHIHTDFEYDQLILEYLHNKDKAIYITDENGKFLKTQEEVDSAARVYIACVSKNDVNDGFYLPVVKDARIGFSTLDMKFWIDDKGLEMRVRHLGNKVVDIEYPDSEEK